MLSFIYGVMGSSKSAQALITRYNYIQKGFNVILIKPEIDNREINNDRMVSSRIGISAPVIVFHKNDNLEELFNREYDKIKTNIVIVDEAQFCTAEQIEQLKRVAKNCIVKCYGLKSNFKSYLFEGSKRLLELADEIKEITHICRCGKNALINARFSNGKPTIDGEEVLIGGENTYESLCYECWQRLLNI